MARGTRGGLPSNWFATISDILRTLLVVRYLDGCRELVSRIQDLCQQVGLPPCDVSYEARREGYYAVHLDVRQQYEIPKPPFDTERVLVSTEIQISTQVQDVLRRLHYLEEGGTRRFENLWLFTDTHAMEARGFMSPDDQFDLTPLKGCVDRWEIKKRDYDFKEAGSRSRMEVTVSLRFPISGSMRATGNNCDHLKNIFMKHIVPNIAC